MLLSLLDALSIKFTNFTTVKLNLNKSLNTYQTSLSYVIFCTKILCSCRLRKSSKSHKSPVPTDAKVLTPIYTNTTPISCLNQLFPIPSARRRGICNLRPSKASRSPGKTLICVSYSTGKQDLSSSALSYSI